jgi:hypothetical protein
MNERIGKLAVEAGAYWDHGDWNMPSSVYFSERDLEKFAALIVRECAGVCEDYRGTEWGKAAECIGDSIKEHFGVE